MRGGVKPSNNTIFPDLIKRFFESIKKKCRELSLVNSELTDNKQNLSSRINEVHCGILEMIKRCRNTSHKTVINCFVRQSGMTHLTKCVAFTLAETLVVMGIIGVVAALTIPNLNQSTGDREKVAKVKKVYSNLEDAFGRATAVYGPFDTWFINDVDKDGKPDNKASSTRLAERMTEFMKISKNCGISGSGCFVDWYKFPDGSICRSCVPTEGSTEPKFLLADGTAILFAYYSNNSVKIIIDIDGVKGPNTLGKDHFEFNIINNELIPRGRGLSNENLKTNCFKLGHSCTGWVIETGNMDYLKANEGVCSNGTELTWENTSCK